MFGINPASREIIREYFEKKLNEYSYDLIHYDDEDSFYIIEDSLILLYSEQIVTEGKPIGAEDYLRIHVEELTQNSLESKYNHSKIVRELEIKLDMKYLSSHFTYKQFRGFDRWYWSEDTESTPEYYNRIFPDLKLADRYNQWEGIEYNYIVFEFESVSGKKEPLVGFSTQPPYAYVKDYVNKSVRMQMLYGGDNVRGHHSEVVDAFRGWKKLSVRERLETKMTYFTLSKSFKEKEGIWRYADTIAINYSTGMFDELERYTYQIPDHKWLSEIRVFELTKKLYPKNKVVFQHRPYYLKTDYGSQLSYDIFIPNLDIAIEYRGKQHYEVIDFFGGKETFIDTQRRDVLKAQLSHKHGIKLIYINYWEEITKELIKKRINSSLYYE